MLKKNTRGYLEVICGSMFSGKTEELIKRLKRAKFAQQKVSVFKHKLDNRMAIEFISSHDGNDIKCVALDDPNDMLLFLNDDIDVIGIDEVQFFPINIVNIIFDMVNAGKRVIVAGLNLDFRGIPFGPMPILLSIADNISKLSAVCTNCGSDANFSQRLINDKAANFDDPVILIGASERYQARCRECFVIDKKMPYIKELY